MQTRLFVARLIYERDRLCWAQRRDHSNPRKQSRQSRASRLAERLQPRYGPSLIERLFRQALVEATQAGLLAVLSPLLTTAKQAHERFVEAMGNGQDGDWGEHGEAVNTLVDYLGPVELERHLVENDSPPRREENDRLGSLLGDTQLRVAEIAQRRSLTAEEKMCGIVALDKGAIAWESHRWASLLHVSDPAIRKTAFWKMIQKNPEGAYLWAVRG